MIDWSIGRYEHTAAELEPVAEHAVSLAAVRPGDRVLDVATGTGNAALLAARAGATVIGIDAAPRLIDVARRRAARDGLDASFLVGDMQRLPFGACSFDVALSVSGVVLAHDPGRAFDEMMRTLKPSGRAIFSAWVPDGPIDAVAAAFARAFATATGVRGREFAWHDAASVGRLAARHGAEIQVHDGRLPIRAASPEAYFEATEQRHPMNLAARPVLEAAGTYRAAREEALAILRAANEDRPAFRVDCRYRVIEVRRARTAT